MATRAEYLEACKRRRQAAASKRVAEVALRHARRERQRTWRHTQRVNDVISLITERGGSVTTDEIRSALGRAHYESAFVEARGATARLCNTDATWSLWEPTRLSL